MRKMDEQLPLRSVDKLGRRLLQPVFFIVVMRILRLILVCGLRIIPLIVPSAADSENQLVIGARGSPLSVVQVDSVISALKNLYPRLNVKFAAIKTSGDSPEAKPQSGPGIKGMFVKEIDEALISGRIDLSVHSAKDLPFERPAQLTLGPIPKRAQALDVLVSAQNHTLDTLPVGAAIGTSSLRRRVQLLAYRGDLRILPIRGNIQTRLDKMSSSLQATVIAQAALDRLNIEPDYATPLSPEIMLPAPGQGLLAIEYRRDDDRLNALLAPLDHPPSRLALLAERAFMGRLQAGCATPAAAWCRSEGDFFVMTALVSDPMGQRVIKAQKSCPCAEPQKVEQMGMDLALSLIDQGGEEILALCKNFDPQSLEQKNLEQQNLDKKNFDQKNFDRGPNL
ncbi:MAG: hydroxymethylbilane synthase [Deltaproteobacteria bacterium]|jgi:hydroxymethylbilane synthase|nr:hydroxymethylbilane synthase [Deltaproteobacteria bacterium]